MRESTKAYLIRDQLTPILVFLKALFHTSESRNGTLKVRINVAAHAVALETDPPGVTILMEEAEQSKIIHFAAVQRLYGASSDVSVSARSAHVDGVQIRYGFLDSLG